MLMQMHTDVLMHFYNSIYISVSAAKGVRTTYSIRYNHFDSLMPPLSETFRVPHSDVNTRTWTPALTGFGLTIPQEHDKNPFAALSLQ